MTSYIGLYYPFIHFKDEAWLKLTALYWDKMARIVPQGYQVHDSDTVKRLAGELDFIKNYPPVGTVEVGEKFLELLQQHKSALRTRYNVLQRDQWPDVPVMLARAPHGSDPKLAYILYEKMSPELQNALVETHLALPERVGDLWWVGMHPKLCDTYMTVLAEQMAKQGLHPLTDEMLDHLTVVGWTVERLAQALLDVPILHGPAPTEYEIEAHLAMVSLQLVIPKGIANVPIETIITLRQQHAAELARLQDSLHTFASTQEQLKGIEDPQILRDHLENEYTKKLRPELEDLKKQLRWLKIDTITGAMSISLVAPPLLTTATTLAGMAPLNPLVAASGAIAFAVLKIVGDKRKQNEEARRASPAAYLLRLEGELKPRALLSWVPGHAAKFGFRQ